MDTVVESGSFISANTAEYCRSVKFCLKNKRNNGLDIVIDLESAQHV